MKPSVGDGVRGRGGALGAESTSSDMARRRLPDDVIRGDA